MARNTDCIIISSDSESLLSSPIEDGLGDSTDENDFDIKLDGCKHWLSRESPYICESQLSFL